MAANFSVNAGEQLRNRRGHDMTWSCDTSGDPIELYCNEHKVALCHPCAFKNHQKPCSVEFIEKIITDRREQLEQKETELEGAMTGFEEVEVQIKSCKTFLDTHLKSVNDEAGLVYEGKIKSVIEAERDDMRVIHQEAEEEMRLIIEKRDKRIKARQEKTEQQRKAIEDTKKKLTSECEQIDRLMRKQITPLENKNKLAINELKSIHHKMKEVRKTDKELVNGAPHAIASVTETLRVNITQESIECLQKIQHDIESVEFVECTRYGQEHYGRILEDIGKWEKVKEIALQCHPSSYPLVVGLISDEEVYVSSYQQKYVTEVVNIVNGHSKKVIEESFTSCAPLDSKLIVCAGNVYRKRVTLYDRKNTAWKVVWGIRIQNLFENTAEDFFSKLLSFYSTPHVAVDSDGMILVALQRLSYIYVINPADGKTLRTITMQGKKIIGRGIHSLPSGNIMVDTSSGVFIISRSGEIVSRVLQRFELYDQRFVTSSGDKVGFDSQKSTVVVYRRNLGV